MQRTLLAARWIFAICCIGFVLAYPSNIQDHVVYVPKWLPPGSVFWVVTGMCFVLAGVAILTGVLDVLAACLLGLMFLNFNLTILPSFIFTDPHRHAAWGGNAYDLAAVGSAWILAAALTRRRAERAMKGWATFPDAARNVRVETTGTTARRVFTPASAAP